LLERPERIFYFKCPKDLLMHLIDLKQPDRINSIAGEKFIAEQSIVGYIMILRKATWEHVYNEFY
jgi:hypothetical protein